MANEKFCASCGAPLKADAHFCAKCGAAQPVAAASSPEVQTSSNAVETQTLPAYGNADNQNGNGNVTAGMDPEKIKKYAPVVLIGLAILIVVIVLISIIVNMAKYTKIDAQELFRLETSGINGKGTAVGTFALDPAIVYAMGDMDYYDDQDAYVKELLSGDDDDYDHAYEDYDELDDDRKAKYDDLKASGYLSFDDKELTKAFKKADGKREAQEMRDIILEEVRFDLSDDKKLKNGDKITVEVDYDEDELKENNIKLKNTKFEVEVKGLLEGETLDPFEGVNVIFDGTSGKGTVDVDTSGASEFIQDNFYYSIGRNYDLSNGDKLTITAEYDGYGYDSDNGGAVTSDGDHFYTFENETPKEFTVEGLKELEAVDVFQYVELEYSGTYPDVYVSWDFADNAPDYVKDYVYIYLDYDEEDLVDGGKISLEASAYSEFEEAGYKLASEEGEIAVDTSKFSSYIKASDVTKDTYATEMDALAKEKADEYIGSYPAYDSSFGKIDSISSVKVSKVFVKINKHQDDWWNSLNVLARVYEVSCKRTIDDKQSAGKFYIVVYNTNCVVAGDGTFEALDDYDLNTSVYITAEEAINDYGTSNDVYTVTEVK